MVTLATLSDIHGQWKRPVYPAADVLVVAGDVFRNYSYDRDTDAEIQLKELVEFNTFVATLPYRKIIVTPGNHDFWAERRLADAQKLITNFVLLHDAALEFEGVKFYGSAWTPYFCHWGFNFPPRTRDGGNDMRARAAAKACWQQIPDDTNVLITHGPPYGILDECPSGEYVGCSELRIRVDDLIDGPHLKLHVFGHIHYSGGQKKIKNTDFKNTALLGEDYATLRDITVETINSGVSFDGDNPAPKAVDPQQEASSPEAEVPAEQ